MLLCGIHFLFPVDVFNVSTHFTNQPFLAFLDGDPYCELAFLQWRPMLVRCDSFRDPATLSLKSLLIQWYYHIRTTFVICNLFGNILRYLPWNVCIKMYLRIGEAKNLDQLPNHNRNRNQSNQTQMDEQFRQSNLPLQTWYLWWTKHLGSTVLTMNSCTCL